jgi:hypothetical protein
MRIKIWASVHTDFPETGPYKMLDIVQRDNPYSVGDLTHFLAAYVIPENCWYIVPAKLIRGLGSICLCTTGSEAKYEEYREAWGLLRKASGCEEAVSEPEETPTGPGIARVHAAMNFVRNYLEKSGRVTR